MLLVRVLAGASKVLGAINGKVVKIPTLASCLSALDLSVRSLMVFVQMVAKAFGGGTDNLAFETFCVVPRTMQFLGIHVKYKVSFITFI